MHGMKVNFMELLGFIQGVFRKQSLKHRIRLIYVPCKISPCWGYFTILLYNIDRTLGSL
jgi:hypothetical protein